jgi:putative ABC transport system permease protein
MTLSPRFRKLAGDIDQSRGRLAMMVVAIALGVFAVASISTAYAILTREIDRNYLSTNPAAATIAVKSIDEPMLAAVRRRIGITAAEAGGLMTGRIEVRPREWLPILLVVTPDLGTSRIGTVRLEAGRWPTRSDEIVLERTAATLANTALEHEIQVQMPHGAQRSLTVSGVVHDPSFAPASQEQTVYGYVTPATLTLLGEDPSLQLLKITVKDPIGDRPGLERAVIGVADWLRLSGYSLGEIRIPPHRHPHAGIMTSVLRMLLVFSVLTLLLGAILTAALTSTLLAPQVRQIGMMKALGARRAQIMRLYLSLITVIGVAAVAVGLPLGIDAGQGLARSTAEMLNLELTSLAVPAWLYALQVLLGVGLPLSAALLPIRSAARRSVRETLSDFGAGLASPSQGQLIRWISRLGGGDTAFILAIRNSFRSKSRLALTIGLLATAGALFMTSLNVRSAWQRNLAEAAVERHFDAEFRFASPQQETAVSTVLAALPAIRRLEPWSAEAVARARPDGLSIVRTYPDGGHGSLQLQAVPRQSGFLNPAMIAGQWLSASTADGAVLNEQALSMFPDLRIQDSISLDVRGEVINFRVIGIVREHLTQATVYTSADPHTTRGIRVALAQSDEQSAAETMAQIEHALDRSGVRVLQSISRAQLGRALGGHLFIMIFILSLMSILMAIVGIMGLGSLMSIQVLERTREFAVMRAIGARASIIRRGVIGEAVFIGIVSACISLLLSLPLTAFVAWIVGTASLGPVLGTVLSAVALPLWLAIVIVGAAAASAYPAWQASALTIRQALDFQ